MPFIPVPNVAAVEVRCTMQGDPVENTFYYELQTPPINQASLDALANTVDAYVAVFFRPLWAATISYVETYCRDLTTEISFQSTNNDGAAPGTRVGQPVDAHSSLVIVRSSGLVGRAARGWIATFGAVQADRADVRTFVAALADAWVTALTGLDASVLASGWNPVIVSRHAAALPPGGSNRYDIVEWRYANLRMDSNRGRG